MNNGSVKWDEFEVVSDESIDWDEFEVADEGVDWDSFEVEHTPPAYLSMQGPAVEEQPDLTSTGILNGVGDSSTDLVQLDNPNKPGYRGDGSVNPEDPRWREMSPYQVQSQVASDSRTEAVTNTFKGFADLYDKVTESSWANAPTIGDLSEEEQKQIKQDATPAEHTYAAGVERNQEASEQRIEEEVDKRVAEKKAKGEKVNRPEIKEEVKDDFKDQSREVVKDVAVGVGTLGIGAPAMLAKVATKAPKAVQYAAKAADQGLFGAAFAGGDQILSNIIKGDDILKDTDTAASIGGALGVGGKVVGDGLSKAYDMIVDKKRIESLSKLNDIGKKADTQKSNLSEFSPDQGDIPVTAKTSLQEVLKTKEGAEELVKLNEHGGIVGAQTLASGVKSKELSDLINQSGTRREKVARKVTGENGNQVRNKIAEGVGLRTENAKVRRSEAFKKSNQEVDNKLDDIIDDVKLDVKAKAVPKETLQEVQSFTKNLKAARAAGNAGNIEKYKKLIKKAEKNLSSIRKGDDFLGDMLNDTLVTTKSTAKFKGAVNKGEDSNIVDIATTIGSFMLPAMTNGYDHSDLVLGGVASWALPKVRKKLSGSMSKSIANRSGEIKDALGGQLGKAKLDKLKSRYKAKDALVGNTPDGALLRAYLLMKEDEK